MHDVGGPSRRPSARAGSRRFVADAAAHQIVELELGTGGREREVRRFGSGLPGRRDGAGGGAAFRRPEHAAFDPGSGVVWVADTGNHALRRISLSDGAVTTVAGTGAASPDLPTGIEHNALTVPLRSPWNVAWDAARCRVQVSTATQTLEYRPLRGTLRVIEGEAVIRRPRATRPVDPASRGGHPRGS